MSVSGQPRRLSIEPSSFLATAEKQKKTLFNSILSRFLL
jgi:hypothetical protein